MSYLREEPQPRCRDLTRRQREVLHFVAVLSARGLPPTLRELGRVLDIGSTHGVDDHLAALIRKGYVERIPLVSRGVRLTAAGVERARQCTVISPGLCPCGATYFGERCPACAGLLQESA